MTEYQYPMPTGDNPHVGIDGNGSVEYKYCVSCSEPFQVMNMCLTKTKLDAFVMLQPLHPRGDTATMVPLLKQHNNFHLLQGENLFLLAQGRVRRHEVPGGANHP
jgi:hypothetical protein